jgi:hypothetical protein
MNEPAIGATGKGPFVPGCLTRVQFMKLHLQDLEKIAVPRQTSQAQGQQGEE